MSTFLCREPADTANLASRLAPLLRAGDILLLCGNLGCGKTLFAAGLAAGLGVEEPVTSPSFVLARQYRSGFIPLTHADIFRLGTRNEFEDLDLIPEASDGVLVIEWGDAIEANIPDDHLRIDFEIETDGARKISFVSRGSWDHRLPGGLVV
ncbi:MAG: tRNA (adenosine(37)-N6)-threonylcarbamoyltransferase complex ATPase subunit type 1 TsaE [Actinomycetota bacterium]